MALEHIYSGDVRVRATSTASLDTRLDLNRRYQSVDFADWHMRRLDVGPGEKILDVGCGTGAQSLRFLHDIGPRGSVSALDISEQSVASLLAAGGGDPRLQAVAADMATLDVVIRDEFRQKQYTLAQSSYALYYSPEREAVLRTMAESIYDFGRVAVFTPAGPHGMVEIAAKFGDVPTAVYDSLEFGPTRLTPLFRQLFWDVRIDFFQSVMRVTSLADFMDFYRATTYYDERATAEARGLRPPRDRGDGRRHVREERLPHHGEQPPVTPANGAKSAAARAPSIPNWFVVACGAISAVTVVVMLVGAWQTGTHWDEVDHIEFLQTYFATGYNTYEGTVVNGQPMTFSPWVAGPAYELVLHAVTSAFGLESWGHPTMDAAVFPVRHLVIALTAVLGAVVTAVIVRVLTRSWRWGVVALTLLLSVPMWAGHGMFNNKDIPVALAYTSVTLALILISRPALSAGWLRMTGTVALLAAGMTLAIGTRLGMWAALSVSLAATVAWLAFRAVRARRSDASARPFVVRIAGVAGGVVTAYLALLVIYPKPFSQPFLVLNKSLGESSNFGQSGVSKSWRWIPELSKYIPTWLSMQLPLLQLVLLIAALVLGLLAVWAIIRGRRRWDSWRTLALALVVLQLSIAPTASILLRSNVYDGIRHFLFILPPIVVLGTLVLRRVAGWVAARGYRTAVQQAVWGVTGVLLLLPLVDQLMLFPYGYAYVNEITTLRPLEGQVSTDYWRTSLRELMPSVPTEDYTSCGFRHNPDDLAPGDDYTCFEQGAFFPWQSERAAPLTDLGPGEFVFVEANRGKPYPPANCEIIDAVTRRLHGQELVMSYVARCQAPG